MSVGEFKSHFSEALDAVRNGESITVTFGRKKKAVAIVSPVPTKGTKRPLGLLAGKARIAIADDLGNQRVGVSRNLTLLTAVNCSS